MPLDHSSIAPDYLGHRERLRQRQRLAGIVGWPDYEVVELLLAYALPRRDVKPIAKRLVTRFGNLRGILDADPESLEGVPGIGANASSFLNLIRATALRYLQQDTEGLALQSSEHLRLFWQGRLRSLPYEVVEVAFLDGATRLLPDGVRRLAEGTTERATVEPRRILEDALRRKAAAIVLAHNHPSGKADPSPDDKTWTRAICLAAAAVQLAVRDHIIIAGDSTFSFREANLL